MKINSSLVMLFCLTVVFSPVSAQTPPDFSKVEISTAQVADGVYMLMGMGGNIGASVGADGTFIIDDQFAPLSDKITAALARISDQPLRFIINTHWHGDHTGGNENLANTGAIIMAQDNVRLRMSRENVMKLFNRTIPPAPAGALPIVTFNDGVTVFLNGHEIRIRHLANAHTDGDSIVYFKDVDVIHTGDIFFNGIYPVIDLDSGGSINGIIKAVEAILALADDNTKFIPGHGPLGGKQDLIAYHDVLVKVRDRVQGLMAQGKSLEQIQAMKPNADLDPTWGTGMITPNVILQVVYESLKKQ
jgi:glyoxylase-like metal-dependent hydrolase (beta-lactamase superfamily II)